MSEPAPRSAILASHSVTGQADVDRFNAILEAAGLGRPLGPPEQYTRTLAALPVSADADLRAVVAKLREAAPEGRRQSSSYRIHTVSDDRTNAQVLLTETNLLDAARRQLRATGVKSGQGTVTSKPPTTEFVRLLAAGAKTGHGTASWIPIEQYEAPRQPPWPPHVSPPVVVVLDSGVKPHSWLPPQDLFAPQDTDFWFEPPEGPSFARPVLDLVLEPAFLPMVFGLDSHGRPFARPVLDPIFGGYWGHATFLAGLIRLTAPDARVMSVKLMNDDGKIRDDDDVVTALTWLAGYCERGGRADVVLMAFGRPKMPGEANPDDLVAAVKALAEHGVQLVASAGNIDPSAAHDDPTVEEIPACLATEPDLPVVSVGAGTSEQNREPYSHYGPWVREWRPGTHVSLMPLTLLGPGASEDGNGYAVWSGTSFSAAIVAGELAQARAKARAADGGS